MKLYRCHGIMNCTNRCPKGLDPAKAIVCFKGQGAETHTDGWKNLMSEQISQNKGRESGMIYPAQTPPRRQCHEWTPISVNPAGWRGSVQI